MRTAIFATHLALTPASAFPQPGVQLATESGAVLIAFMAFACQVGSRQKISAKASVFMHESSAP